LVPGKTIRSIINNGLKEMLHIHLPSDRQIAHPVILGAGLTGLAISRSLSAAGVTHVLVGNRPTDSPRLGESLNAEGSLEIARLFPRLSRFFFRKRQQALFFGGHALSFDSIAYAADRVYSRLLGYPATVQLLHVDRVGFDRALFEAAIADDCCLYREDRAVALDYHPATDRIHGVQLASGQAVVPAYVFDATNDARFVARKLGVRCNVIGEGRRVVFAHYSAADGVRDRPPPWMQATALLRLDGRTDSVEGLAWCIPLGDYVSVGTSVDPEQTGANPSLLLDWVDRAYATRGIDVRRAFPNRGTPVDLQYEHYTHERCYGRNWLLAGPSCCQVWFPSASGVAAGLIAARLAPDVLRAPSRTPAVYQAYLDQLAATHSMLDWLVRADAWSVTRDDLEQRSQALMGGNAKRLARYLRLRSAPAELAFGDALSRLYQSDRRLANLLRIDTSPPQAQATRLFVESREVDPWTDAPIEVAVLSRPDKLEGPAAILGLVEVLSGRREPEPSAELVAEDLTVQIDQFQLKGVAQWNAWVSFLRGSPRVTELKLVPGSLSEQDRQWVLTCQWQGLKGGRRSVSPRFSIAFGVTDERVAAIQTRRADYTFVAGDSILPAVAFAALLGQLVGQAAA
jgi:flavin-dependent dehydrogenase